MAKKKGRSLLQNILLLGLVLVVLGVASLSVMFVYFSRTIPDPEAIINRRVNESTKIFDATGETVLYEIHGEEKRTVIPWEDIPENVKIATLAAEDLNFYNHKGIDFRGLFRALAKNIKEGDLKGQGGSTITQQLVGNALVGRDRSSLVSAYTRKIKEALLALEIERRFTKDEIFWMYLNQVPYGSNAYGIEAASKTFFAKSAQDLTLNEAAVLAALPNGPTLYSPYGNNVDLLMARKDLILTRLKDVGFISEEEYEEALEEELVFEEAPEGFNAPHFVILVRKYLVQKYGDDFVEKGGLNVYTTLDPDLQKMAEDSVAKYASINKTNYNAYNAALTAVDPKTGHILAMVGSKDYFGDSEPEGCTEGVDCKFEGNFNVATALRQPGSSFKPFAYSALFRDGYPDTTVLFDLPTEFNPECSSNAIQERDRHGNKCYHPQNYTGTYAGPITLRNSLAQSKNVTSVKALYLAGIDDTIDLAHKLGITSLNERSRYGLSLVLGGGEVRLVDMVSAFSVFANDGIRNESSFIVKVVDSDGDVLEENIASSERVLDTQVARMINDVLSDNNARGPVFGYNSSLYIPGRSVAAKTGTTQENRDAWTIGYSPTLAAGVWVGNNDNSSMTFNASGLAAAAPVWKDFMLKALPRYANEDFVPPQIVTSNKPMLSGNYTISVGNSLQVHNILYYVNKNNPLGSSPSNPSSDDQFINWEAPVLGWAQRFTPAPTPTPTPTPTP